MAEVFAGEEGFEVFDEGFNLLFERPPQLSTLRPGAVLRNTFRFLGTVRSGDMFYLFARLDPYEQAELSEKSSATTKTPN